MSIVVPDKIKDQDAILRKIISKTTPDQKITDEDYQTVCTLFLKFYPGAKKTIERIQVETNQRHFSTKCLKFYFDDGTNMFISRKLLTRKTKKN